jgi:hypothetical protein
MRIQFPLCTIGFPAERLPSPLTGKAKPPGSRRFFRELQRLALLQLDVFTNVYV